MIKNLTSNQIRTRIVVKHCGDNVMKIFVKTQKTYGAEINS